ncbi:MAG: hypothetical protein JOZ62_23265 [Acidobacteriaceae bacterium]|nr:hypothetical protein [Acidobacteriaceae bacterium]
MHPLKTTLPPELATGWCQDGLPFRFSKYPSKLKRASRKNRHIASGLEFCFTCGYTDVRDFVWICTYLLPTPLARAARCQFISFAICYECDRKTYRTIWKIEKLAIELFAGADRAAQTDAHTSAPPLSCEPKNVRSPDEADSLDDFFFAGGGDEQ